MVPSRGKTIQLVESSVERTARMLSSAYGIRVVWHADEVKTDGKTIYLPVLPDDAPVELLEAVQGYLDHETAHILFTNFKAATEHTPELTDEEMHCVNVVEDVRVETAISKLFPGSPHNLRKAHEWMYARLAQNWDLLNQFQRATTAYFDFVKNGESSFWQDVVDDHTKSLVAECVAAVGDAAQLYDTYESINAGLRMFEVLRPHAEEHAEQNKQEQEQEACQGSGDGNSSKNSNKSSDKKTDKTEAQQAVTGFSQLGNALTNESSKRLQDLKNSGYTHNLDGDDTYLIYSTAKDTICAMPERHRASARGDLAAFRRESNPLTSVLKTRFVNALRTQSRRRWLSSKDEGRLDSKRLHRSILGLGDNVYKQQSEKLALDTVVMLAIDHSGSMSGGKLQLAGRSAIVLGDALAPLKIPLAVYGYSTQLTAPVPDSHLYARSSALWIRYYKDFNDSWDTGALKLASCAGNDQYNTLDGESVKHGVQRLLQRKEPRKILIVLNDGQPYPGQGDVARCQVYLKRVVKAAAAAGVEVIAFGIQDSSVKEYYPNYVVIDELEDLIRTPLQALDAILRKGMKLK